MLLKFNCKVDEDDCDEDLKLWYEDVENDDVSNDDVEEDSDANENDNFVVGDYGGVENDDVGDNDYEEYYVDDEDDEAIKNYRWSFWRWRSCW